MESRIVIGKSAADPMLAVFAAKANVELFDTFGPTSSHFAFHGSFHAVTAYWDDQIVGFIIFSHEEKEVTLDIRLGYVRPEYRRRGVYRQVWTALVEHARTLGVLRIWGGTDVRNEPMRKFWASVGRKEESVSGHYAIPKV